jgi:hypothetical protein
MMERRSHHPPLAERFAPPPPEAVDPTPAEAMAARAGGRDPGRYRSASSFMSGVAWNSRQFRAAPLQAQGVPMTVVSSA